MTVRVLIADDHPAFTLGVRFGLEANGLVVVDAVHDGSAAIDRARDARPDAVVLDVRMPTSGLDACRSIIDEGSCRAVVMLTTYDDPTTRRRAREAGARAFLTKETPVGDLAAVIELLVREPRLNLISVPELPRLTSREREVLAGLSEGLSNKAIATRLGLSPETVKDHCSALFAKLEVTDRHQAVREAQRLGMTGP